jgi:hypothetical protein
MSMVDSDSRTRFGQWRTDVGVEHRAVGAAGEIRGRTALPTAIPRSMTRHPYAPRHVVVTDVAGVQPSHRGLDRGKGSCSTMPRIRSCRRTAHVGPQRVYPVTTGYTPLPTRQNTHQCHRVEFRRPGEGVSLGIDVAASTTILAALARREPCRGGDALAL